MTGESQQQVCEPSAAPDDAWLESLLRDDAHKAASAEDDGFTASVMARLPAPGGASLRRWIVPCMALLGSLIGLLWSSGGETVYLNLASLMQLNALSLQSVLIATLPIGLLYWLALGAALQQD